VINPLISMKKIVYLAWLVLIGLVLAQSNLLAQSKLADLPITVKLGPQPLSSIFKTLEQGRPLRIYFRADQLPSNNFSLEVENQSLETALNQLLRPTMLSFFIYRNQAVIVAPRAFINEVFSSDYYQALEEGLSATPNAKTGPKVINIGDIRQLKASGRAKITGKITQEKDKTAIIGATVRVSKLNKGAVTDENGRFELELPVGKHQLLVQYVGNADLVQDVQVSSDGEINLVMESAAVNLDEVVVGAKAIDANVQNVQIGVTELDAKTIKRVPTFMGEADVVKSLLRTPGVSSIGEGATGFNVRGGEVDQNLVLQNDAMIFNSSHALGFFSSFNADLVNRVTLYKGNIPAQYGGRLASVLDVEMRDGDFERFKVKGGVGPVTSRLSLEGPIISKKTAFIAGLRSSYSDWILENVRNPEVQNSSAFFYDANLQVTHRFNEKNTLVLAGYASTDEFSYNNDFGFEYSTYYGQAIYKKVFSKNVFSKTSFTASQYKSAQFDYSGLDASRLDNNISYLNLKEQVTFTPKDGMTIDAGFSSIYYQTLPGERTRLNPESFIFDKSLENENGLESALFGNLDWKINSALQVSGGLRLGLYQFLGPKTVYQYSDPARPSLSTITDTIQYGSGKTIATYGSIEPRVSARYRLNPEVSFKMGYSRTAQFINQIFNTDSPTPTSQYQLSTDYIKPTRSHNFSLGYFRNFKDNLWETSVEVYGRLIDALFDYRDFAELTVNPNLETELLNGKGRAYGAELSIRKNRGVLNGSLAYTMSRTERLVEGINRGTWYPSNFNKPHDLSVVLNYQYNQRHSLTVNFTYGTGRPTTAPQGSYRNQAGVPIPIYSDRNALNIPDYHRLDVAYTLGKDHKKNNKFKTSWTFSVYNLYGRRNAFSVFFTQTPFTGAQANRLAILGAVFPSITFNFETI
jgi:hypothetical protein